ncbi:hypothetical protein AXK11_07495 [Cephaloticoccus primus]|uniref:Phytanoyl-CoA dioxygenase n=1 Tax=Cephaloticoccus primus TaxID=1548207 RepID=A0A139SKG5_9BACT|nr:hypothetical protein AXK11_07495 [Cephaloticoccus primus]
MDEASLAQAAEAFHRDGYFIARGLFSPEEVEDLNGLFMKMHADGGVPGFYEPGKLPGVDSRISSDKMDPLAQWPRVMHPHRFNAKARAYLLHPKVRVFLEKFMGGEPVATQTMYYFKPPGARGQAMHQDNFYLLVQPGTCMAAWTALDDCDAENGGLMVVPNSHNNDLVCPDVADAALSYAPHRVPIPQGQKPVPAEMKAGDTLFFNGNVIHGSGPNRSKTRFRRSWICHYAKGDLAKISKYYTPVVSMDGRDLMVEFETGGGPCGGTWEGAAGA